MEPSFSTLPPKLGITQAQSKANPSTRGDRRHVTPEVKQAINDWHQQLRQLVASVCQHPPKSRERRKGLNEIVRLIEQSRKLWWENSPYYEDALFETWLYFSRNLCEATTTQQPYDPEQGSVTTWLNAYLKRRLQDWAIRTREEQAMRAPKRMSEEGEVIDPVDNLPSRPFVPPILEAVREWAETDADGELRRIHVKGHPEVTCQILILRRLPPETAWKHLAEEFGLSVATLSGFYESKCRPQLRKFGESEGYL